MDQLRLRFAMLWRHPDDTEIFNLVPSCKFETQLIRVMRDQLMATIPGGIGTVRAWIRAKANAVVRDAVIDASRLLDFHASATAARPSCNHWGAPCSSRRRRH